MWIDRGTANINGVVDIYYEVVTPEAGMYNLHMEWKDGSSLVVYVSAEDVEKLKQITSSNEAIDISNETGAVKFFMEKFYEIYNHSAINQDVDTI